MQKGGYHMLNDYERKKYAVISKLINHEITAKEAMLETNLSVRQIYRLKKIYNVKGEKGFIHKTRGKISKKKIDNKILDDLENLYLTEYDDYSIEAFYEEIQSKYNLSYSLLLSAFKKDDIISRIINLIEILINSLLIDPFLFIFPYYTSRGIIRIALWICFYFITAIMWTGSG